MSTKISKDLLQVAEHIDRACLRSKHNETHQVLEIPGRDDAWFVFCTGWNNRIFLVWKIDGKIHHEWFGGIDGYQVLPDKSSIKLTNDIVELYCTTLNFIGASPGARIKYNLGKVGKATPVAVS